MMKRQKNYFHGALCCGVESSDEAFEICLLMWHLFFGETNEFEFKRQATLNKERQQWGYINKLRG